MPSTDEHLRQAKQNEGFVDSFDLKSSPYLDWALTGIFYSAVHYIEAVLAINGKHPIVHSQRNTWICMYINNSDIYDAHRDLKDDSRDARYKCITVSEIKVNESKMKLEDIKKDLKTFLPQIV